jgi:hypothetical protein
MSTESRAAVSHPSVTTGRHPLIFWQLISAALLLVMGGIHLYLVFHGVGGLLGGLFVVNTIGALALAISIIVLRGKLLSLATVLGLLFMAGTLLALALALTVGLFGIRETLDFQLVYTTLVVESIGTIVLAVTTALALRPRRTMIEALGPRLRSSAQRPGYAERRPTEAPARRIGSM